MTGKTIVVSTSAWDTTQPGSNFIPAQFYYDTDIIQQPDLAEQTSNFYFLCKNNSYHSTLANGGLGVTKGVDNPTLNVLEGYTLQIYPPGNYHIVELKGLLAPATPATYNIATTAPSSSFYNLSGTDRNGTVSGPDASVTILVGDTVNFNLQGVSTIHPFYIKTSPTTGTGNQVTTPAATGQGSTGTATVSWTPNEAGTYYYICSVHGGMVGTITVTDTSGYVMDPYDLYN